MAMKRRSRMRFVAEGVEGAAVFVSVFSAWPVAKRWLDNWGATGDEQERAWPGDALCPPDRGVTTRAISIDAPASAVWPWIAQFGLRKAGFYSYELLERLIGIPVENLESIEPTMQSLAVGDEIQLHPKAPGIPVGLVEPGGYVCFGETGEHAVPDTKRRRSWSIYVEPVDNRSCRLIVRGCIEHPAGDAILPRVLTALEHPVDFVMEQRMLRTVKRLAEMPAEV